MNQQIFEDWYPSAMMVLMDGLLQNTQMLSLSQFVLPAWLDTVKNHLIKKTEFFFVTQIVERLMSVQKLVILSYLQGLELGRT